MTGIIQRLDAHVANQIAAGEVVQRPASVVKELLENAIDAGASKIELHIENSGKTLVQVGDNGQGMNAADAQLCFERHATSKLKKSDDLFAITTKGFRGEALASIAAVAQVQLKTKLASDELGTQLSIEGGTHKSKEEIVFNTGTLFTVKNLFFNIPARRNFLKSDRIELGHIIDEFHRVALVHNAIDFSLFSDKKPLFQLKASNKRQRIVQIFGTKINDKLVPIDEETPLVKISGFILKPELSKKGRGMQFFFVNQRYIKSPYLNKAINDAFEGLIQSGTHPGYFIEIEVDPKSVDVNIHPTKTEVKFEDDHTLFAILRSSVKHSLGQFNVAPTLDFEMDPNLHTPYAYKDKEAELPKVSFDRSFNPFEDEPKAPTATKFSSFPSSYKQKQDSWESLYINSVEEASSEQQLFSSSLQEASLDDVSLKCFQLDKKFVVSKTKSGMLILHQQRAHQRILYERFLSQITLDQRLSQTLIFPVVVNLTKPELQLAEELSPALQQLGFDFELEEESISIKAVPALIAMEHIGENLEQLFSSYREEEEGNHFSQSDILAKSLAKSNSIKTGDLLNAEQQMALVNDLFSCKEPGLSPFVKPTYRTVTAEDITQKFFK